jgi:hypothetical protein
VTRRRVGHGVGAAARDQGLGRGTGAGAPGGAKKKGRGKERKKRKKKIEKKIGKKKIGKEIGKGRKRREKGFRKLEEILGKLEGRGKRDVVGFFGRCRRDSRHARRG